MIAFIGFAKSDFEKFVEPELKKSRQLLIYENRRSQRRHERDQGGFKFSPEVLAGMREAQEHRCYFCGVKLGNAVQIDHLMPVGAGGDNSLKNAALLCPACNRSKHDKTEKEFWKALQSVRNISVLDISGSKTRRAKLQRWKRKIAGYDDPLAKLKL